MKLGFFFLDINKIFVGDFFSPPMSALFRPLVIKIKARFIARGLVLLKMVEMKQDMPNSLRNFWSRIVSKVEGAGALSFIQIQRMIMWNNSSIHTSTSRTRYNLNWCRFITWNDCLAPQTIWITFHISLTVTEAELLQKLW